MGASHSKGHSNKQPRKSTKATKTTKNKSVSAIPNSTSITTTKKKQPISIASSPAPLGVRMSDNEISMSRKSVGIDLYATSTPSILIRDHIANQPLSSLFPDDIPETPILSSSSCSSSSSPSPFYQHSTVGSYVSTNSSAASTLSDMFSTLSVETPTSTLSTMSRYTKRSTTSTKSTMQHVPLFGDGPSSTTVTPINEETTATNNHDDDNYYMAQLVQVAQSKINGSHPSLIQQGFQELVYLAESRHCLDAYYPLAECYYLGHHHPSKQPDKLKALDWFLRVANLVNSSLPTSTIAWAQYRVAIMLVKGDQGVNANVEEAVRYFSLSAHKENKYAQYMLGLHFQHGLFMQQTPDLKQSLYWYERAARHGFSDAQVSLGQLILDHLDDLTLLDRHHSPQLRDKWVRLSIHWLELAAKQKNVKAHLTLGVLYDEGELISRNATQAIYHYEEATTIDSTPSNDKQLILAHYFVGINYRIGKLVPQNHSVALKHLEVASKGGYAPAQRALGLMYLEGVAVGKDERAAYSWFTKAAMQGDIQALGLLGQQAERRGNTEADIQAAIHMYKQAASSGSVTAQLSLAHLLLRTDRRAEAFPWFQMAATNDMLNSSSSPSHQQISNTTGTSNTIGFNVGHVRQRNVARLMVARYKLNGWGGVAVDRAGAFQELVLLSDQEQLMEAHFWLAACYEEGVQNQDGTTIVDCDLRKAFDYYMKSALGGDVDGQFHVALMLANGVIASTSSITNDKNSENVTLTAQAPRPIIEKDPVHAFKWYSKAAERGHSTAQYSLGLFYERGLPPVSTVELEKAKCWYERASQQQHTTAMISLAQLLLQEPSTSSHEEALHWLHKAATMDDDKNYTAALRSLAGVFEQGKISVAQSDPDRYQKGWLLLQKAADKEDCMAFVDMARYHEHGLGVEKSIRNAVQCLIRAEELGYLKAKLAMAELYYRHDMWQEALSAYEYVAETNNLMKKHGWIARLAIAKMLLIDEHDQDMDCMGLVKNVYNWLSTMVTQSGGSVIEPLELLGICYEHGKGTKKDIDSAITHYEKVIQVPFDEMSWVQERTRFRLVELYMQTDHHTLAWQQLQITKTHFALLNQRDKESRRLGRTARFYLGYLLLHGENTGRNTAEAQLWLSQAADEGEGNAALELAKLCIQNKDTESAKKRLDQGISAAHSGCMVELALLLERNEDPDNNDHGEIVDLLERAIELGNADAMYHQARLHHEAYLGDPSHSSQSLDAALACYMDAAAKGDIQSMVRIGQLYDTLQLYDDAQAWFAQSSSEYISVILLMIYHLKGLIHADISINGQQLAEITFQELLAAVQAFWSDIHSASSTPLLDKIDRQTIGDICFFLGQSFERGHTADNNRKQDDMVMAELWYNRAVDVCQHKESIYSLGSLMEAHGDYAAAIDWFRLAAEKWNHAESQYQLGVYHAHGAAGLEVNLVAAQRYLKLAYNQGLEKAKTELGMVMYMHAWDLWHNQKQYQRGLKQFEKAATLVPDALVELGHLYHTGFSSEDSDTEQGICIILKNHKQAFSYYSEAVRQGNAKAALMIGSYYEEGYLHDMENLEDALKWYEKAYQWKCGPLAELAIGKLKHSMAEKMLLENNIETALDLQEEAYTWFEGSVATASGLPSSSSISMRERLVQPSIAAGQQCSHAKVMMALYHLKGLGRKPCNPVKGFEMLMDILQDRGSDDDGNNSNNNVALTEVAMCYDRGIGVDQDINMALHYWEAAAKIDDVVALRRTAEIYRLGLTGSVDLQKADYYCNRADTLERSRQDEREKSFCSISSSSSSSYASRRSSMNSLNSLY